MRRNNINHVLRHYLLEMLELYQVDDSQGIDGYCQVLKGLLYSALDFLPGNFSRENVEIELNQKLLRESVRQSSSSMPWMRIWDGKAKIFGYIDILEPGTTKNEINAYSIIDLNKRVFPNLILTNFFEFWYYRAEQNVCTVRPFSVSHHMPLSFTQSVRSVPQHPEAPASSHLLHISQ